MLHRGTSGIFCLYPALGMWFKSKKRDSEMSHLYKTRLKKSSSTEFNENWLYSREYLEECLGFFFGIFCSYPTPAVSFLKWKKRDLNSQKCHKIRDLKTRTRQNSMKSNSMVRRYSGEHLEFSSEFSVHTSLQQWASKWRKRDSIF